VSTQAEKALAACLEYDRWMREIAGLSAKIGTPPSGCSNAVMTEFGYHVPNGGTHLDEVFRGYDEDGAYEPVHHHWSPQEAIEILDGCPHCSAVYAAIQARKLARQELGITKRKIRAIARATGRNAGGEE
jgi:hypothetical protein